MNAQQQAQTQLSAGFSDAVHDAQNAFRGLLDALSRPGRRVAIGNPVKGLALGPAMAHLLLTLTDDDTPVWWQQSDEATTGWLRFHTGASVTAAPELAAFAVVTDAASLPPLEAFAAEHVCRRQGWRTRHRECASSAGS
jgi:alpha-D-ribose 1-methylphosphonate 5-triphosphate synthase subunit PhnH